MTSAKVPVRCARCATFTGRFARTAAYRRTLCDNCDPVIYGGFAKTDVSYEAQQARRRRTQVLRGTAETPIPTS